MPTPVPDYSVLVVDDFEGFRQFVCQALARKSGFRITQASDGLEAVRKAEELQPDLVLLDIALPKLNGLEAGRRIRTLSPESKIVFLSLESSPDVIQEARALGARGYVQKHRAQTDLLPAIEIVLQGMRFVSSGLEFSEDRDTEMSRHELLFFSDEATLLDGLTRFTAAALKAGNPAMALVTESHQISLLQRLRASGVDIDSAIQRGMYVADETPDPARFIETIEHLSRAATQVVAICGDCAARLWAAGRDREAVELERMSSAIVRSQRVDILCAYPRRKDLENNDTLKSVCAEHSVLSFC